MLGGTRVFRLMILALAVVMVQMKLQAQTTQPDGATEPPVRLKPVQPGDDMRILKFDVQPDGTTRTRMATPRELLREQEAAATPPAAAASGDNSDSFDRLQQIQEEQTQRKLTMALVAGGIVVLILLVKFIHWTGRRAERRSRL